MTSMWRTSGWILVGSALILALSLGVRHGFGLFLAPMSAEFGWGRETFAFAIALQNLIWGLAQPFTGALADRFGATKAVFIGGVLYAAGLVLMGMSDSAWSLSLSAGLLIGIGLSGTSFSVILGVVGRAVPPGETQHGHGHCQRRGVFRPVRHGAGYPGLDQLAGLVSSLAGVGLDGRVDPAAGGHAQGPSTADPGGPANLAGSVEGSLFPFRILAAGVRFFRLWFPGGVYWCASAGVPGGPAPARHGRYDGTGVDRPV
ncbi:hypothetical protein L1887_53122 [Cichorium endivia]|nr:hypothetical protein L1887_53122 [Cichorium endivia]